MVKTSEVGGSLPWPLAAPNKRYEPGRVCAAEGCTTKLSIYNETDTCWRHRTIKLPTAA